MTDLKELKQQLVDYLSDHFSGQGVAVMGEFPPSPKPSPLLKSRIAVGFDAMAVQDAGLDDYLGRTAARPCGGGMYKSPCGLIWPARSAWGVGPAKAVRGPARRSGSFVATAWGGGADLWPCSLRQKHRGLPLVRQGADERLDQRRGDLPRH